MRLVILSDTHGKHADIKHVPDGDVLIHCGDCTGDIGQAGLRGFLQWFHVFPHKHKILIAGNHDGAFEKWPDLARQMVSELAPDCEYLQDSGKEIDGVYFYGSPVQPAFCNWYFNRERGQDIRRHWDMIPEETDVLITHGPPYGYLDISGFDNEHCGCRDLYEAVLRIQPKVHCFGHIHHDYGARELFHDNGRKTLFVNASICDEAYRAARAPFIFNLT